MKWGSLGAGCCLLQEVREPGWRAFTRVCLEWWSLESGLGKMRNGWEEIDGCWEPVVLLSCGPKDLWQLSRALLCCTTQPGISGVNAEGKGWSGVLRHLWCFPPCCEWSAGVDRLYHWLFSMSSGSLTGLHLSTAKWKFLQLPEKLVKFHTLWGCRDFLFSLLFIMGFSNLSMNRENGTTNPMCLLPSFSNNFCHSNST